SDCQLIGGQCWYCLDTAAGCSCPSGGAGLYSQGSAFLLDSTTTGGPGRLSDGFIACDDAPAGPDTTGNGTIELLPGESLRASTSSPVRENGTISVHLEGPPNVPIWLSRAPAPRSTPRIRLWRGISLLNHAGAPKLAFVGITDANGVLERTLPVGTMPAGL